MTIYLMMTMEKKNKMNNLTKIKDKQPIIKNNLTIINRMLTIINNTLSIINWTKTIIIRTQTIINRALTTISKWVDNQIMLIITIDSLLLLTLIIKDNRIIMEKNLAYRIKVKPKLIIMDKALQIVEEG